jgi:acetyl-CoA carboxylase carboxyl transferase subunit alpha
MSETIKDTILKTLKELDKQKPEKRIDQRIEKFCSMGVVVE